MKNVYQICSDIRAALKTQYFSDEDFFNVWQSYKIKEEQRIIDASKELKCNVDEVNWEIYYMLID